jgi:hypothetical protein
MGNTELDRFKLVNMATISTKSCRLGAFLLHSLKRVKKWLYEPLARILPKFILQSSVFCKLYPPFGGAFNLVSL